MRYLAISYFIYLLFQLLYIGFRDTYGIPMFLLMMQRYQMVFKYPNKNIIKYLFFRVFSLMF